MLTFFCIWLRSSDYYLPNICNIFVKRRKWFCLCILVFWSLQEILSKVSYMQCLSTCNESTKNKQSWKKWIFLLSKFKTFVALTRKPQVLSRISIIFSFNYLFWCILSQMYSEGMFPRKFCLLGRQTESLP